MQIHKHYSVIYLIVGLIVLTGCCTEPSPILSDSGEETNYPVTGFVQPADKGQGRIVFVSFDNSWNGKIYVMNDDGTEQTRLTYSEANDSEPSWSPDGRQIAFTSDRDGLTHVYIMNADGSQVHRLTNLQDVSEGNPEWSPDGNFIVFKSTTLDGQGKVALQLVDLMSGEIKELVGSEYVPRFPSWSSDSQSVWFASSVDHDTVSRSDLYTVHIAGGEINRITHNGDDGWGYNRLTVSPNGQRVLHTPSARDPRAFILDVETLEVFRVFNSDSYEGASPEGWSPDSNAIIFFLATDDIYADLYRYDFQEKLVTQLTNNPGHEMLADWWAP